MNLNAPLKLYKEASTKGGSGERLAQKQALLTGEGKAIRIDLARLIWRA